MDQPTLTGAMPPVAISRQLANVLGDMRSSCDDRGEVNGWKYHGSDLRLLARAGLLEADRISGRFRLTERGRLAPLDIA